MTVQSGDTVRLIQDTPVGNGAHYHKGATGRCVLAVPGSGAWPALLTLEMSDGEILHTGPGSVEKVAQ